MTSRDRVYSTYLGNAGINKGWGVAVDRAGKSTWSVQPPRQDFPPPRGRCSLDSGAGTATGSSPRSTLPPGRTPSPWDLRLCRGPRLNPAWLVDNGLASTRMLFDGVAAPLIYVSATQTSAIMPYAVAGKTTAQLQIEYRGVRSPAIPVTVADAAPGLFTIDSSGRGQGAILNQEYTVNSASNPAAKGPVVILFATGEGLTNPAGVDGKLLSAASRPRSSTPGLVVGVLQVNVRVPQNIASGAAAVVVTIGSASRPAGLFISQRGHRVHQRRAPGREPRSAKRRCH